MHSGIGYMPSQGVLGGSIIMPSVFQNSVHIEDPSMPFKCCLLCQLIVFRAKSTCQNDAVGEACIVLNLKHSSKVSSRKFIDSEFICSNVM